MKIKSLIFLLIIISLVACKKEEDKATTSSISGKVKLFDDGENNLNNIDMTVTVEGTAPLLSAKTDQNGEYSIQNVPFGSYTLQFNKTGYGTYKIFNAALTNTGGPLIISETISLGQFSTTSIINRFSIDVLESSIEFKGTVDPAGTTEIPRYLRIFYSSSENVSSTNYSSFSDQYGVSEALFQIIVTTAELNNMGFASGTTVYMKMYGDSYWSNSYEDPSSGKMVFPNLNSSPVSGSFIVPD